jgi:hypothetical protein
MYLQKLQPPQTLIIRKKDDAQFGRIVGKETTTIYAMAFCTGMITLPRWRPSPRGAVGKDAEPNKVWGPGF